MAPYWFTDSFDPVGNRTQRVVHAVGGDTTTSYGYASGTHQVTTVTSMGRAGSSASSFVYDDAGNTVTRDVAGDPVQALVWDAEGELVSVTAGASTDTYVYTADGDRLVRRQAGATTVYLPGGMELTATGGTVSATRYYSFNGQVVAVRTGPGTAGVSTLVADHHGTAGLSIANTTRVVTRRHTDPYGAPRGTAPAGWAGDHGFLDKPVDSSGLVQVGARYYDPALGRFISVDPVMDLADPQHWHGYAYANNNPITFTDPTGLAPMIDGQWGSPKAAGAAKKGKYVLQGPKPPTIKETLQQLDDDNRLDEYVAAVDGLTAEDWEPEMDQSEYLFYAGRANYFRTQLQTCEWAGCMEPCPDMGCEAGRAGLLVVGYVSGELLSLGVAALFRWAAAGRPVPTPRLEQDVAVSPVAPRALPLARPVGLSPTQNAFVQNRIGALQARGATHIRVNQQQVDINGARVGINRPDLQYTLNGRRYYEEFETLGSNRGPGHIARIRANDPAGIASWQWVP